MALCPDLLHVLVWQVAQAGSGAAAAGLGAWPRVGRPVRKCELLPRSDVLARKEGYPRQQRSHVPHSHKLEVAAITAAPGSSK